MNNLPLELKTAIQAYLAENGAGPLSGRAGRMSENYRRGGRSDSSLDFAAYLTARLPATFAAVAFCLAELARRHPCFAPQSVIDAGSGPGTASWAGLIAYPDIRTVTFLDNNTRFLQLAASLAAQSSHPALSQARALHGGLANPPPDIKADMVIAAYAFAELQLSRSADVALALWRSCEDTLLIIEPGTPQGFARIRQARTALIAEGAHIVAPCTHMNACPISEPDWCHFSVRLPRSREHMHAKQASVPFEDEKFSYLIASRQTVLLRGARILAPPVESKAEIKFTLCAGNGLNRQIIARRDKAAYKQARKLGWGDLYDS